VHSNHKPDRIKPKYAPYKSLGVATAREKSISSNDETVVVFAVDMFTNAHLEMNSGNESNVVAFIPRRVFPSPLFPPPLPPSGGEM
jgi:hypothetical protein